MNGNQALYKLRVNCVQLVHSPTSRMTPTMGKISSTERGRFRATILDTEFALSFVVAFDIELVFWFFGFFLFLFVAKKYCFSECVRALVVCRRRGHSLQTAFRRGGTWDSRGVCDIKLLASACERIVMINTRGFRFCCFLLSSG